MKALSSYSLVLILILFLQSCSSGKTTSRDYHGKRPLNAPRSFFPGIKKKVSLLNFFNESPFPGQDLGVTASSELRNELSRTGQFTFDPMSTKIFGSSKEIYSGGGVKLVKLARKAKVSGINFVIFGRVMDARIREKTDEIGIVRKTRSYSEAKIEIRIFDVNANKEIFSESVRGFADDSSYRFFKGDRESNLSQRRDLLRYAVKVAIRRSIPKILKIAEKLDWVGRVAKIIDSKIYVNAGRASGLQIGDVLKVMTEGQDIYDPETGALIGTSKGEIKGTLEVIDYFGPDGTIAILHSGGSVLEGDFVQLH